jgi:putative DNA methylase
MKKALIEDASIELLELFDEVSKEARKEKLAGIPINRLHYWWTRKPLIVGRFIALTSTLDDITLVKELLGLNREKRAFRYQPDLTLFKKNVSNHASLKILDPFAGAGNLALPILNLDLDVTCSDYNPVAYLIEKATLEFPITGGSNLAEDFEKIAKSIVSESETELKKFFEKDQLVYLWVWCIDCPFCSQRTPLSNHMWLDQKQKTGIEFTPLKNKKFTVKIIENISDVNGNKHTQKQGKALCISCGNSIDHKTLSASISKNKDREMIAIQIKKQNTRKYILPSIEDKKKYENAVKHFKLHETKFVKKNLLPKEEISPSDANTHRLWQYNIRHWDEYFSERQKLTLVTIVSKIIEKKIKSPQILLYLALMVSKLMNYYTLGTLWDKTTATSKHTLTLRRASIVNNHSEINPFEKVAGSLDNHIKSIKNSINFLNNNKTPKINLESVTTNNQSKYDLIITDPPYGDDVQYGELSEFFYVWIYKILKNRFLELPEKIPLDEDFSVSQGRFGNKKLASQFFEKGLKKSFISMNDKLKDDGLLVVFFAHSSSTAWNQLLDSINESKFKVISSYAIHTENPANVIAKGKTSFMSSIVVVCRKILKPSEEYFEDIIPKIEDKIKIMLKQIPAEKLLSLPITDLLIMVYGKVLEECTQHTTLKSYQKDFTPDFETLIKDARSFIMKELVRKITGKSMNVIGPRMAFYLLIKIFHKGMIGGDDVSKIIKIYDVKIEELENEQVVIKDKDVIRLFYLNENEMDYSPDNIDKNNLHQQLCYLCYTIDSRGSDKVPGIISKDNFRVDDLKQIISLLINNYHLRKNKGESLIEKEQKEMKILETLADIMGIKVEGVLDTYFEK